MQFGQLVLPAASLDGLATLDEVRGQGLGTHLLAAAERKMMHSGAWSACCERGSRISFAAPAGPSAAAISAPPPTRTAFSHGSWSKASASAAEGRIAQVRPWRRWEEEAIARVYRQNLPASYGLLERTRSYWHWLLEHRAYDQFYVALDGPDLWDLKETSTQVVGYAAIRGEKIVELMTVPGRKRVVMELLARACGDAIEQDHRQIALHAAVNSPALDYFHGGPEPRSSSGCEQREFCMAKLLDPLGLLQRLCGTFAQRAAEAGLARPVELGLLVDGRKYQIDIAGSGRATADTLGRSYLRLNVADFTRLLLGQLDWDWALAEGRVVPSTALAHEAARVLFPPLPYWRPLLDDLLA